LAKKNREQNEWRSFLVVVKEWRGGRFRGEGLREGPHAKKKKEGAGRLLLERNFFISSGGGQKRVREKEQSPRGKEDRESGKSTSGRGEGGKNTFLSLLGILRMGSGPQEGGELM